MHNHSFSFVPTYEANRFTLQAPPLRVFGKRSEPYTEKEAIVRKLSGMPASAVLLFEDEFIIRLFPVLQRAWSLRGEPAQVSITGRNDKRVVFDVINVRSGHRILKPYQNMRQESFQDFIRVVRRCYRGKEVWMMLDNSSAHTAQKRLQMAEKLRIKFIWLPKQCPELSAKDHFWRQVKADISTNHQYSRIDQHVALRWHYRCRSTNIQAFRRAGILSKNFWLKKYS